MFGTEQSSDLASGEILASLVCRHALRTVETIWHKGLSNFICCEIQVSLSQLFTGRTGDSWIEDVAEH